MDLANFFLQTQQQILARLENQGMLRFVPKSIVPPIDRTNIPQQIGAHRQPQGDDAIGQDSRLVTILCCDINKTERLGRQRHKLPSSGTRCRMDKRLLPRLPCSVCQRQPRDTRFLHEPVKSSDKEVGPIDRRCAGIPDPDQMAASRANPGWRQIAAFRRKWAARQPSHRSVLSRSWMGRTLVHQPPDAELAGLSPDPGGARTGFQRLRKIS